MEPLVRRLFPEFLGTALLVAIVVGSGIMATTLTGDAGVQLLINAMATAAGLGVLIWVLAPISGAHLNPAITVVAAVRRTIGAADALGYISAQIGGAVAGATLANIMFSLPAWSRSTQTRTGAGLWIGEIVATGGLLMVVGAATRMGRGDLGPVLIPAWIGAAYFFTASTSFANPAVTIGRAFSDTFAGIAPASVPAFIAFQLIGAAVGATLAAALHPPQQVNRTAPQREGIHQ